MVTSALEVLRTDPAGVPVWRRDIQFDPTVSVTQTPRCIVDAAGGVYVYGLGFTDALGNGIILMKLSDIGVAAWCRFFPGMAEPAVLARTSSDGLMLCTSASSADSTAVLFTPIAADGSLGATTARSTASSFGAFSGVRAVVGTPDGGMVYCATVELLTQIVRLAPDGSTVWSQTFQGTTTNLLEAHSLAPTADGGHVMTALQYSGIPPNPTFIPTVIKLDDLGAPLWSRQYSSGIAGAGFRSVFETPDGQLVFGGTNALSLVVLCDENGEPLSAQRLNSQLPSTIEGDQFNVIAINSSGTVVTGGFDIGMIDMDHFGSITTLPNGSSAACLREAVTITSTPLDLTPIPLSTIPSQRSIVSETLPFTVSPIEVSATDLCVVGLAEFSARNAQWKVYPTILDAGTSQPLQVEGPWIERIEVMDATGRILSSDPISIGSNTITFDAGAPGVYPVRIIGTSAQQVVRIVVR